jgi:hypothetical protein
LNLRLLASATREKSSVSLLEHWTPGYETTPVYVLVLDVHGRRGRETWSRTETNRANAVELYDQAVALYVYDDVDGTRQAPTAGV